MLSENDIANYLLKEWIENCKIYIYFKFINDLKNNYSVLLNPLNLVNLESGN